MKWDEIHGVGGIGCVISGWIMDDGCGGDWVMRNVMELCGVICGWGVGARSVEGGGICGIEGGDRTRWEARVMCIVMGIVVGGDDGSGGGGGGRSVGIVGN